MPAVPRPDRPGRTAREPRTPGTTETPDSAASQPAQPKPRARPPADAKLAESVRGMYQGVGMLALGVGMQRQHQALVQFGAALMEPEIDPRTGEPIPDGRTGADKITDAWMTLADRNPRVKATLVKFTEGGAAAEVIVLHATLLYPFLPGLPGLARFLPGVQSSAAENGATPHAQ